MLTSKEWTSFSKLRLCVIEILQNNKLLIIHFFKWVHFIQLWSLASHSSGLTTCFSRHTSRRAPNSCFQRADNSLPTKSQMQSIHSSCSQQVQLLQNLKIYLNAIISFLTLLLAKGIHQLNSDITGFVFLCRIFLINSVRTFPCDRFGSLHMLKMRVLKTESTNNHT